MNTYLVKGGRQLLGETRVQGAKNSILPILAACLLGNGEITLHCCPHLSDVGAAVEILRWLGCQVTQQEDSMTICTKGLCQCTIPDELMQQMRSSIVFLGAIVARCRQAQVSLPGGCALGARPIDLHLSGLRQLGVEIEECGRTLTCISEHGLHGAEICLAFPSVGATENMMIAAVTAKGNTTIYNAAKEPEIEDLANFLIARGAKIKGAGSSMIYIVGGSTLHGCDYTIMPDRIVAATLLCCTAATKGEILLRHANPAHLQSILPVLSQAGCQLRVWADQVHLKAPERLCAVKTIVTQPYPGFPTDAQAIVMAMLASARGVSVFEETIFENRYQHVGELVRMGANITVVDRMAKVRGVEQLHGAVLHATDLRGGAALVVAALGAQGESRIDHIDHVLRGYDKIEKQLQKLGAVITVE